MLGSCNLNIFCVLITLHCMVFFFYEIFNIYTENIISHLKAAVTLLIWMHLHSHNFIIYTRIHISASCAKWSFMRFLYLKYDIIRAHFITDYCILSINIIKRKMSYRLYEGVRFSSTPAEHQTRSTGHQNIYFIYHHSWKVFYI